MKNRFILPAFLFITFLGCTNPQKLKNEVKDSEKYPAIENARWLIGNWQSKSAKGLLTESWRKQDDSTMVGQGYFMAGDDTLSLENIRLELRNGTLSYIPLVSDQNNGRAFYFTLTRIADSLLVFENPEHDFPQKISYALLANDSLVAEVSAITEGKVIAQTFRMGRKDSLHQ